MVFSSFRGVGAAPDLKPPGYVQWVADCTAQRDALARQPTPNLLDRYLKAAQINALTAVACLHPHGANAQTAYIVAFDGALGAKSLAAPLLAPLLPLRGAAPWAMLATAHLGHAVALGVLTVLGGQWQRPQAIAERAAPPSMVQSLAAHGLLGQFSCAAASAAAALQRQGHRTLGEVALGAATVGALVPALTRVMADGLYAVMALPSALVVLVFGLGCDLACLSYGALRGHNEPELYLFGPPLEAAPPGPLRGVPMTTPLFREAQLPHWQRAYVRKQRSLPPTQLQVAAPSSPQVLGEAEIRGAIIEREMGAFCRLCDLFESKSGAVALYIFAQEVNVGDYLTELSERLTATVAPQTSALYGDRVAFGREALRTIKDHSAKWRHAMGKRPAGAHLFEGDAHRAERRRVLVALREALAFTGADDLRQRHCSADLLRARGRAALDNARPPSPEVLLGELHAAERAYIIYSLNGILTKLAKIRCPGQMAALLESHRLEAEVLIPKMRQLTDSIRLYASHQEPEHRCEAMAAVRYWLELRDNVGKYQPLHSFGKRMGLFVHPDKIHALNLHRTEQELAQSLYALTSELSTTADSLAAPAL